MKNQLIQCLARACVVVGASAVFAATSAHSQNLDKNWDNGNADNDWNNPVNWSGDALPFQGAGANVGDKLHINLSGANRAIYTAAAGTQVYQFVRLGDIGVAGTIGELEITGGTLTHDDTDQTRIGTGGRTGIFSQSGGTFNAGGIVQVAIDNGTTGTLNLSGGIFNANRDATADTITKVSLHLGAGNGTTTGTVNMTGGLLATRSGVLLGQNTGGVGVFSVGGAGQANIGHLNTNDSGFWVQRASGTLMATVDSTGFTLGTISLYDGFSDNSFLTFAAGSVLDLGFSGAAPGSTMSWDLMTFADGSTITDGGLTLGAGDAAAGWSFGFVDAGGSVGIDTLRITYTAVPEPAVSALAGLGLLMIITRARRRA